MWLGGRSSSQKLTELKVLAPKAFDPVVEVEEGELTPEGGAKSAEGSEKAKASPSILTKVVEERDLEAAATMNEMSKKQLFLYFIAKLILN